MTHSLSFQVLGCLAAFFTFTAIPSGARAEMPPRVYQDLQKKSPEALTVKVVSVKISTADEPNLRRLAITAEAKVETVERSASGLKPGNTIRISYEVIKHKHPFVGPGEPGILEKGRSYPAFLSKNEKYETYEPAAKGNSFRKAGEPRGCNLRLTGKRSHS
jgi:hypothetical protein